MDEILRKIDEVKERVGVSYQEAKEALDKNGGSVIDALIYLEQHQVGKKEVQSVLNDFQEVIEKGKETRIRVYKEGKKVAEVPVAAGILGLIGTLAVPGGAVIGALGSVAALMNKYSLEIKKNPDKEESNQNDIDNSN